MTERKVTIDTYPIPLNDNHVITVNNLPDDLTDIEATKIYKVLSALINTGE